MVKDKEKVPIALLLIAIPLAGCLDGDLENEQQAIDPATSVGFHTRWDSDPSYLVRADGILPQDFFVRITEAESGQSWDYKKNQLRELSGFDYDLPLDMSLQTNATYILQGLDGDLLLGERELRVVEWSEDSIHDNFITYDYSEQSRFSNADNFWDYSIQGELTYDEPTTEITATGSIATGYNGWEANLDKRDVFIKYDGDRTINSTWRAQGDWSSTSPAGSGNTSMIFKFEGHEAKADDFGESHLTERYRFEEEETGTYVMDGVNIDYTYSYIEVSWYRLDTMEGIWTEWEYEERYCYPYGACEVHDDEGDHALKGVEAEPELLQLLDFTGKVPSPMMEDDFFRLGGLGNIYMDYTVLPGQTWDVSGTTYDTLKLEGSLGGNAWGTEEIYIFEDGESNEIVAYLDGHYNNDHEETTVRMEISAINHD